MGWDVMKIGVVDMAVPGRVMQVHTKAKLLKVEQKQISINNINQ